MAKLVATRASCLSDFALTDTSPLRESLKRNLPFWGNECKETVCACTVVPDTPTCLHTVGYDSLQGGAATANSRRTSTNSDVSTLISTDDGTDKFAQQAVSSLPDAELAKCASVVERHQMIVDKS